MYLNDLLRNQHINPATVLVLRHRPTEAQLNKVLPWLAAELPDVFNAYQQTQGGKVELAMTKAEFVASFIGHTPGKALFVGLYKTNGSTPMTRTEYWAHSANQELKKYGMIGFTEDANRDSLLWFDLQLHSFYQEWKGKLIVSWPPPERSWWRWANRNDISVNAIAEDSLLVSRMPQWNDVDLGWVELNILPNQWKTAFSQWRGIYFIFDASDGKGYVGSAYGETNLLGRWLDYAARGHGGNRLLRHRDPNNFRFTILQLVSQDMDPTNVIQLEASWKRRLHTQHPQGLNDN